MDTLQSPPADTKRAGLTVVDWGLRRLLLSLTSVAILPLAILAVADLIAANRLRWEHIGLIVALAGLSLIFAKIFADRFILSPMNTLASMSQRIASGDLSTRSGLEGRANEFGRLGASMDFMAESLLRREAEARKALRELGESERRFRTLFDSSPDAIMLLDASGEVLEANPEAENRRQAPPSLLVGETVEDMGPEEAARRRSDHLQRALASGREIMFEETRDGRWYDIRISPVKGPDGTIRQLASFSRDVTARKRGEEAQKKFTAELERRVAARTHSLAEANEALSASLYELRRAQDRLIQTEKMAALGELVAGVAHEINTPLGIAVTAISYLGDLLADVSKLFASDRLTREDFEDFLDKAAPSISAILANLQRAADLVQHFKQTAAAQACDEKRLFNLAEHLDSLIVSLRPRLKPKNIRVSVNCPANLTLYSHPGAFMQIVSNLVINSIVHAFEGRQDGRIALKARLDGNTLTIRYSDDGAGMAAETAAKVFDPFFTTRRGQGGTGLGLHIVYNLASSALGGAIDCTSAPGMGATFQISIPVIKEHGYAETVGRKDEASVRSEQT
ncbi:MAG: two-component system, autoinducer 2 sensor kinase/phosphatase LuxQ [Desulfovibrionales bacterium]|nr:two-component system, autoinducer 2 sensor kinase/phosphatase LuxQ [Desulfovibrionales bacterium]